MPVDTIADPEKHKLNEYDLYRRRLHAIEDEAYDGLYGGESLRFLSTVEFEFDIVVDTNLATTLHNGTYDPEGLKSAVEKSRLQLPEDLTMITTMSNEERREFEEPYRQMAREYVRNIPAHTPEQELQKRAWLANVDNFTTQDIINFRLYCEFSQPTLGPTSPPKSLDHSAMIDHSDMSGWLEFRFGTGTLQTGYYDNPGKSEVRFMPCSPSVLIEREEIVNKRLVEIAAEHGAVIAGGSRHINLSVYTPHYQDNEWRWFPVLGRDEERRERTTAALAGLTAGMEDAAWMRHSEAADKFNFGKISGGKKWMITTNRDALRLLDDYIELRDPTFMGSTAHGLLWMMAAISHGLEVGTDAITAQGHSAPEVVKSRAVLRTRAFDKNVDLQFQRALEQSEMTPGGFLKLSESHVLDRADKLMEAVLGDVSISQNLAPVFASMLMLAIEINPRGYPEFSRQNYKLVYDQLPKVYQDFFGDSLSELIRPDVVNAIERYVARGAVQIMPTDVVNAQAHFPGLEPLGRKERWKQSPIVQRMYGPYTAQYTEEVFATAMEYYAPIDIDDDAQYLAALKELIDRRNEAKSRGVA